MNVHPNVIRALAIFVFLIAILNFFDGLSTYMGIVKGVAEEKNPFLKSFVENYPMGNFVFKTIVAIALMFYGIHIDKVRYTLAKNIDLKKPHHILVLAFAVISAFTCTVWYGIVVYGNFSIAL